MLYAVATMDTITIHDTQQAGPVCLFTKLHYDEFTDMSWSVQFLSPFPIASPFRVMLSISSPADTAVGVGLRLTSLPCSHHAKPVADMTRDNAPTGLLTANA